MSASVEESMNVSQADNAIVQVAIVTDMGEVNIQVQVATTQDDGFNFAAANNAPIRMIGQNHELIQTVEGLRFRSISQIERQTYAEIVDSIYTEASHEGPVQSTLTQGGDSAIDETCSETCIDFCCQSCVCNFQNPFLRQHANPLVERRGIMTPILQRGRAEGWKIFTRFVLPLVRDTIRDIWVIAELLTVLAACALSVTSFVKGNRDIFNTIHLVLICLSTVMAFIDACLTLKECKSCRACKQLVQETENDNTEDTRCYKCKSMCKNVLDFARILLAEIILYPLLVCDLINIITGDVYRRESVEDHVSFALFILSSISLILYVYIARILILIGAIYNVHKQRQPIILEEAEQYNYDNSIAKGALYFQGFFLIHTLGQMIAQVMMLVAIGAKIEHANKEVNLDCKPWQSVCISPLLWYMLVAGWIMPICGFLTFFIVTYYWVQQFPIGLCIDFVRIMEMPGVDDLLYPEEHFRNGNVVTAAHLIANFVRIDILEMEFKNMRSIGISKKFFYPFQSPVLIILCFVYALLQLGFVICAAVADTGPPEILNGGGWSFFYIAAIITLIITNLYTFAVVALWVAIIMVIILMILFFISYLFLCCFLFMAEPTIPIACRCCPLYIY